MAAKIDLRFSNAEVVDGALVIGQVFIYRNNQFLREAEINDKLLEFILKSGGMSFDLDALQYIKAKNPEVENLVNALGLEQV